MPWATDATLIFFCILFVFTLCVLAYTLYNKLDNAKSLDSYFLYCLAVYLGIRIVFVALLLGVASPPYSLIEFVLALSWLAGSLFTTAFTIVLASWVSFLTVSYSLSGNIVTQINRLFIITNVVVWVANMICMLIILVSDKDDPTPTDVGTVVSCILDLSFSLLFLLLGARLYLRISYLSGLSKRMREQMSARAFKIVLLTLGAAFCFTWKFAFNLYRYLDRNSLQSSNLELFMVLFYIVPEIIPVAVQLIVQYLKVRRHKLHPVQPVGDSELSSALNGTSSPGDEPETVPVETVDPNELRSGLSHAMPNHGGGATVAAPRP